MNSKNKIQIPNTNLDMCTIKSQIDSFETFKSNLNAQVSFLRSIGFNIEFHTDPESLILTVDNCSIDDIPCNMEELSNNQIFDSNIKALTDKIKSLSNEARDIFFCMASTALYGISSTDSLTN